MKLKNLKFFENLYLSPSEFRLILIGKDGWIKLNTRKTSLEEIFSLIDTMPMRQEECSTTSVKICLGNNCIKIYVI